MENLFASCHILVGFVFVVAFFVLFGLSLFLGIGNLNSLLFLN